MVQYLKIVSVSATSPEDLFTLGVSTSRGKVNKIGQFGSGTLLGTLAWMRAYGDSPIFLVNGKKVRFTVKNVAKSDGETFGQVIMKVDKKSAPLSVALEYGAIDWPNPELGLREWITNAIDQDADIRTCITIVDEVSAAENEVAVFVRYTPEVKTYFENLPKFFLHAIGKQDVQMLEKDKISPCRIFRKGVFIRELEQESICDYNLSFSINECRTGSSDSIVRDALMQSQWFCREKSILTKIANAILENKDILETQTLWTHISPEMETVWREMIGQVGICSTSFKVQGCAPINGEWYESIVKSVPELDGADHVTQAEVEGYTILSATDTEQSIYNEVCELFEAIAVGVRKDRPPLRMFETPLNSIGDRTTPSFRGLYVRKRDKSCEIMICKHDTDIRYVMVHELCHHYSQVMDDYSTKFTAFAHDVISQFIKQLL